MNERMTKDRLAELRQLRDDIKRQPYSDWGFSYQEDIVDAVDEIDRLATTERETIADLLMRAADHLDEVEEEHCGGAVAQYCPRDELRETAARLRQDVPRVGVPASAGPMERLEQMDVTMPKCGHCGDLRAVEAEDTGNLLPCPKCRPEVAS